MSTSTELTSRAEFYLVLAQAFMPPESVTAGEAMKSCLADDLEQIAAEAGYALDPQITALRRALGRVESPLTLLQDYSGLFLQPPREVQINASLYLDGAVMGRSVDRLEAAYRTLGLERAECFRDLPDHLSVVLEFLALLHARAAQGAEAQQGDEIGTFVRDFLLCWVPHFARAIERAVLEKGHSPVYLHLARVLQEALVRDAGEITDELWRVIAPERFAGASKREREMLCCRECGAEIAPAARVRRVKKVLEKEGIDTGHLDLCMNCRGSPGALLGRLALDRSAAALH